MNVLIIYFSQTGNTKNIAEKIEQGVINSGNNCEMISIKDYNKYNLKNYDLIGLGTPTFFYREPINIQKFIKNLEPSHNLKHWFLFCTHGSLVGNTFYYMNKELSKKGFRAIGTFDCYASSSIQFYPQPMHTDGHPDEIELKEAQEFGRNICDISAKVKSGNLKLCPRFTLNRDAWWAKESEKLTMDLLRKVSPKFTVNSEKCTRCLSCQEQCPVDAIDIESDPPEIQREGCIFCWYCEKLCLEGAIEADWTIMRKINRGNLKRYVSELKTAEKIGKFRPHIDYEKII